MADVIKTLNGGLAYVAGLLNSSSMKYIAWGTGTTAATEADTGLETPGAEDRTAGTQSLVTVNTTDDTYQVVGTITCTGTSKAITEVAVYSAASNGTAIMRATFDAINVNVGDSISFNIKTVCDQ
jgi:predicted lysophospholipase L1 biosynthesis ABC-type transport system permease subunit